MIRIRLRNKTEYSRLRQEYLKLMVKYVGFDESDILNDDTKSSTKRKTTETAKILRKRYPELYNFLFQDKELNKVNRENLKMLLVGPEKMPASFGGKGDCFPTMNDFLIWLRQQCMPQNQSEAKAVCKTIFRYKNGFGKSQDAYRLLRSLNVHVCPYCNRIYTITLPSKQELAPGHRFRPTRPTFDHFYSQDECPFLALSLFNLVPSCHICNGNKHATRTELVYPYDEAFEKKAVFRVIPKIDALAHENGNPFSFLIGESDSFYIKFMGNECISLLENTPLSYRLSDIKDETYRKRIENSIQVFSLEEQYCEHNSETRDILRNHYYFNENYIRSVLCPMIQEKMSKEGHGVISQEQIMVMAMDMIYFSRICQDEWGERPLSKLTADILEQVSV